MKESVLLTSRIVPFCVILIVGAGVTAVSCRNNTAGDGDGGDDGTFGAGTETIGGNNDTNSSGIGMCTENGADEKRERRRCIF